MSTLLPTCLVSTASTQRAGKLAATQTVFLRMHGTWLNGSASIGRVCMAISAKSGLAYGSTGAIGGAAQNTFIGIAQGDTGPDYVPPVMLSDVLDMSGEGRRMIGVSSRVGLSYTNYNSGNQFVRDMAGLKLRANTSLNGGLSATAPTSDLSFSWSEFTGTPETGGDTTFNVTYITAHFRRITSTTFGVRIVCGRGNQPGNVGSMDFANGRTPAQIIATVDGRADGSSPYAYDADYPEWIITSGDDPSAVFASYPWFVFQNPLATPIYILRAKAYASL